MSPLRIGSAGFAALAVVLIVTLLLRTFADLQPAPASLEAALTDARWDARGVQVLDRNAEPLNVTFTNSWNVHDLVALHETPEFLRQAFVAAEDKRFYEHHGVDWSARLSALVTNVRNARAIRGASTITEQVVRMLHPRPRSVWSRWLEGWEAGRLERAFSKDEILEFYLNQVPYASNRRGVRQAASYYFARSLSTLSKKEMLALAVLVRAPTRFDLLRSAAASEGAIERLANALVEREVLSAHERDELRAQPFTLEAPRLAVAAPHFVQYARSRLGATSAGAAPKVTTTLDARLQWKVQGMLDERLSYLSVQQVTNGAVLAVDHSTGEVLAWVVAGGGEADGPLSHIDAVTTPRQPGSALKPFLYALALDSGWSAAELIDDAPLTESTAGGLHSYQNYSRRFYGLVTLRDALGNSLNIPALKTLQHVGSEAYLARLRELGFESLEKHPDFYGDGIALGSGAVTLFELVQGYATLANGGVFRPLSTLLHDASVQTRRQVFSAEAASLIANILSDPDARALEFGRDSVLALPLQTAVKTGTSSDFRDAWAVGFNYRYTVGVWMGNLDQTPSDGVTGSVGPALLLRSVFTELTRDQATRPLYLSPRLTRHGVCVPMPWMTRGSEECLQRDEWFLPGT
ncbi:MAG TPA: transglycosylase domain-containing protein, partial [Gammaproteobacteria bacterium]|nr:transglycosylase domain-containing protein [Gammaproteobacteria bacterium]